MHYFVKERVQREIENHEHDHDHDDDHMSLQQHIETLIINVLNIRIIRTFIMVRVEEKCRFCSVEGFIPNYSTSEALVYQNPCNSITN